MKPELIGALIAGLVASASAAGTIWSSVRNADRSTENANAIARIEVENKRRKEISNFKEPLARSAYDLQSRLYNILEKDFLGGYLIRGDERERSYSIENTIFVIAQYFCWVLLTQRRIYFIDLQKKEDTFQLLRLQDEISQQWGTDEHPRLFRVFAGEQQALGEALIQPGAQGPECMGYRAFRGSFKEGVDPIVDALRKDVVALGKDPNQVLTRLTNLQHALIKLLKILDPEYLLFPETRRKEVGNDSPP